MLRPALTVIVGVALTGCGGAESSGPNAQASIRVLRTISDTIDAQRDAAVSVEVRDAEGKPAPNVAVSASLRFPTPVPYGHRPPLIVVDHVTGTTGTVRTDGTGLATLGVAGGSWAGHFVMHLEAAAAHVEADVELRILPGHPVVARAAVHDTALYLGATIQTSYLARDRFENVMLDPPQLRALSPCVTISPGGILRAVALGASAVELRAGTVVDTLRVSVVPQGMAVLRRGGDVALVNLDGSDYRVLVTDPLLTGDIGWLADDRVIFKTLQGVFTVSLTGQRAPFPIPVKADGIRVSANHQWVFFSTVDNEGARTVYRVAADGSGATIVLQGSAALAAVRVAPSPDGSQFATFRQVGLNPGLHIFNIADGTASPWGLVTSTDQALWSPAGHNVYFSNSGLLSVDTDGTNIHAVTPLVDPVSGRPYPFGTGAAYSSSPDGEWLVIEGEGVEVVRVSTGQRIPLYWARDAGNVSWH